MSETVEAAPAKHTSASLYALLRERYDSASYALFSEVPNGTGGHKTNSADALAMSLWPSRGLTIAGFEIKVSRSDWVRELGKPAKAEAIQRYCDHRWIVVPDSRIMRPGELPPTWGVLAPERGKLRVKAEAPKLRAKPLDRHFVAAILRSCQNQRGVEAQVRKAKDLGWQEGVDFEKDAKNRELEDLRKAVAAFEEASGVRLDAHEGRIRDWTAKRVGEAVKGVLDRNLAGLEEKVDEFAKASGVDPRTHWSGRHLGETFALFLQSRNAGFRHHLGELRKDALKLVEQIDQFEQGGEA